MSTVATLQIGDTTTTVAVDTTGEFAGGSIDLPCGVRSLRDRHFSADPPLPHELTNAIGEMLDHLDDALREVPALVEVDRVVVSGHHVAIIANVEHGGELTIPTFTLTREAAEDVFRTVATEPASARRHNPGLPAKAVDDIVAACCALVAVMRGLHLSAVEVPIGATT